MKNSEFIQPKSNLNKSHTQKREGNVKIRFCNAGDKSLQH